MADLLVEIGCEEIPAGYIGPALEQWAGLVSGVLTDSRLGCESIRTAGTPRRLALFAAGVSEKQEDVSIEVTGPPVRVAFDADGKPTKAAIGFAKKQGIDPAELKLVKTDKGEYCAGRKEVAGRAAKDVLAESLPETIAAICFPKSMRWATGGGVTFARPIRMILALLDTEVIDFEINAVRTGRTTVGHPFLSPEKLTLERADFDAWLDMLREHHVVADIAERRDIIAGKISECLAAHGSELEDEELLREVTNLVEFPNIVEGSFEEKYLKLPEAVLEESMKSHQRYFPVRDAAGKLLPRFIAVTNRDDKNADTIREGNERVLRARLADAEFFLREDTRTPLAARLEQLKGVTFQVKLGSYYDRVQRLRGLAQTLAQQARLSAEQTAACARAAELCKNDLVTNMVGEFPKLQGVVGREYALRDGEPQEVADAIAEHYAPRGAADALPHTITGCILSLAEKLDALLGCFSVGLAPTGSQDPYALRRAAQGILRILMEQKISVSLSDAVAEALRLQPEGLAEAEGVEGRVLAFMRDRLYHYFTEAGYRYDQINAVLATGFGDVPDTRDRLNSVAALAQEPGWEELVTVVQRTRNILKNEEVTVDVAEELLQEEEEKKLWAIIAEHEAAVKELIDKREYLKASELFARVFVQSVHEFFDKVFVNVDDQAVRQNRLALMKHINDLYTERVADLSEIVPAEGQ
ncbi:MAG: glycine--tRNA ligase subunit beta [Planctomycetes bacterium]|nr:glycine--tRNA ligase subunit beta [Planctomycetota bacterium]